MKHAGEQTLDKIESTLEEIRTLPRIKEKKRGIFYLKSKSFLHFHEDISGIYADYRTETDPDFVRVRVSTLRERKHLVTTLRSSLMND